MYAYQTNYPKLMCSWLEVHCSWVMAYNLYALLVIQCSGDKIMWKIVAPSEKFELTADSLSAYIETHRRLILRIFSQLTVNSQDEFTLLACCELSVSLQLTPWACCELFVRSRWWAHHAVVVVSSLSVSLPWAHRVGLLWSHCLPHGEIFRLG